MPTFLSGHVHAHLVSIETASLRQAWEVTNARKYLHNK